MKLQLQPEPETVKTVVEEIIGSMRFRIETEDNTGRIDVRKQVISSRHILPQQTMQQAILS